MNHATLVFITIAIAAFKVSAEPAYRHVDDQGNVTFSDKPVKGATQVEQVSIDAPAPSEENRQEAQQREAALQKAASQTGASTTASKNKQNNTTSQELEGAEKRLDEATQVREGDRIGTAGGGSRLAPEYHQRVKEAEAEVDRVRKQVEEVK